MNKIQAALVLATGITLGAGGSALVGLGSASAAPTQFQFTKIWVDRIDVDDAGVRAPVYQGMRCSMLVDVDGGNAGSECPGLGYLTSDQSTAFEAFLTSMSIAPPR